MSRKSVESRKALARRPCSRDDLNTAEICCITGLGISQRQESDPLGTTVWTTETELCGAKLLRESDCGSG
jgi:hypothetical protein